MSSRYNRRSFLKGAGGAVLSAAALSLNHPAAEASPDAEPSFRSHWPAEADRPWPGPEYWTNPLQDWRIREGRLECFSPGGDRNTALLTRSVAGRSGEFTIGVRCGRIGDAALEQGFFGFRLGIKSPMNDYRAAAIYGQGMNAGVSADGRLFIGEIQVDAPKVDPAQEQRLLLSAQPSAGGYLVTLRATGARGGHTAKITRVVAGDWLAGQLALVCSSAPVTPTPVPFAPIKDFSFYPPQQKRGGSMRFWFSDWSVAGSKIDVHEDRAFGPILFTLYTLSRGTMKLSAQFPPLGAAPGTAFLETRAADGSWTAMATAALDPDANNALFRLTGWDDSRDHAYRVRYSMAETGGSLKEHTFEGVIRKDPAGRQKICVALLTCLWDFGFPHQDFVANLAYHKPDLLLWTGDQIYEPVGGFGVIESRDAGLLEPAMLDFQRKWFLFGWSARDLTRSIPSVCMTDDHDMYHGNIWGCGGRPTNPAAGGGSAKQGTVLYSQSEDAEQDSGGYKMPPRWVNMVQRLQTAHLPDPFDSVPVLQGISVYYTDLLLGGVSFAILEDRKWKSAPVEQLPEAKIVNGFAHNPSWNAAVRDNVPDAELLGQRQLNFLESWAADWSGGTWMKFAVSQTIFGCLHTEPECIDADDHDPENMIPEAGTYLTNDHLVADYDSGAWPQQERDAAILIWRKGFAAHLCGDQHLGTTSHYGVESFRDGVYSVCTPAISNIWPRRWFPPQPAPNALPGAPNTGDYLDGFGNRMTVFAAANPARYPGPGLEGLRLRATGYTILHCDRLTRKITIAAWPRWIDPSVSGASPYKGWPITIDQLDNGLWHAEWELERIETPEFSSPVVQIRRDSDGEAVYTLRIQGQEFTPPVREPGAYTVLAYDPDGFFRKEWKRVEARRRVRYSA